MIAFVWYQFHMNIINEKRELKDKENVSSITVINDRKIEFKNDSMKPIG